VINREPFPRSPKPGHDLISDEQDPVVITQGPHALQVAFRRNNDPISAGHRFEKHCCDGLRAFILDDLLQVVEVILAKLRLGEIGIGAVEG
jgi:hypothetical protein